MSGLPAENFYIFSRDPFTSSSGWNNCDLHAVASNKVPGKRHALFNVSRRPSAQHDLKVTGMQAMAGADGTQVVAAEDLPGPHVLYYEQRAPEKDLLAFSASVQA